MLRAPAQGLVPPAHRACSLLNPPGPWVAGAPGEGRACRREPRPGARAEASADGACPQGQLSGPAQGKPALGHPPVLAPDRIPQYGPQDPQCQPYGGAGAVPAIGRWCGLRPPTRALLLRSPELPAPPRRRERCGSQCREVRRAGSHFPRVGRTSQGRASWPGAGDSRLQLPGHRRAPGGGWGHRAQETFQRRAFTEPLPPGPAPRAWHRALLGTQRGLPEAARRARHEGTGSCEPVPQHGPPAAPRVGQPPPTPPACHTPIVPTSPGHAPLLPAPTHLPGKCWPPRRLWPEHHGWRPHPQTPVDPPGSGSSPGQPRSDPVK